MSFEQAKVSFHTGRDEALVSKQVNLEWEISVACQETEALQHELEEVSPPQCEGNTDSVLG